MKDLEAIRTDLDAVDRDLVALFERRMSLARQVAQYKLSHGLPVLDRSREDAVLASRVDMLQDSHWASAVRGLYEQIMALSRAEQEACIREEKTHD